MNALLYALVVVIWGTTWIAIFTTGTGGRAGIDFLAFRRSQRHDAGDSARHTTPAAAGRERSSLLPAAGLLRLLL